MSGTSVATQTLTLQDISFPKKCNVILMNDDVTPMEFVVSLLIELFDHTHGTAEHCMLSIHENGKGVAGVYDQEIAEQKAHEASSLSRENGFPLEVDIENA